MIYVVVTLQGETSALWKVEAAPGASRTRVFATDWAECRTMLRNRTEPGSGVPVPYETEELIVRVQAFGWEITRLPFVEVTD